MGDMPRYLKIMSEVTLTPEGNWWHQVPRDYVWGYSESDQKVMGDMQVPRDYVWGYSDD